MQSIPTNNKSGQMDMTMLRQISRAANLAVFLSSSTLPTCIRVLEPFLTSGRKLSSHVGQIPAEQEAPEDPASIPSLPDSLSQTVYCAPKKALQFPFNSRFSESQSTHVSLAEQTDFSSRVRFLRLIKHAKYSYHSFQLTKAGSIIEYISPTTIEQCFGEIYEIFQHARLNLTTNTDVVNTYLAVVRFRALDPQDAIANPFVRFPELNIEMFYAHDLKRLKSFDTTLVSPHFINVLEIIEPKNIVFDTASYTYESQLFGIKHTSVAVKSLSRGRHNWAHH